MGKLIELPATAKKGWPWNEEVDPAIYDSNTNWPKITIVTPSYNQGDYIEETIRSIVLQNYPNLEYIVMDGGSNDRTLEILEQYKDAISICVSEKDKGQSDALIKGFNLASGDFLNWINSDDILSKMGLFHIASASLKNPEANFIHGRNGIMTIDSELYSYMPHPEDNLEQRYISEMPYGQQACFFSRQLYINCGGINRELRFSMDYELYLRMHLFGTKTVQIPDLIGCIRIHDNTKTAQLENIMRLENGNAFMTFLESAGDLRKAGFLRSTGHLSYGTYKINIPLSKKFIRLTFLAYLKKNIWYYYNVKQIKVAARMAIQIMKLEPSSLINKNYLKIILDGIRQGQFN